MTIEIQGHVQSLSLGGAKVGEVEVTIVLEASRSLENLKVWAKRGEVDMYRPGMPVTLMLRPSVSSSEGRNES